MMLFRYLIWAQSLYTFATGVWPIIDIQSFMQVTGPKADIWLVKTVGALLIPVSIALLSGLYYKTAKGPASMLGGGTAIAFICIDFYYALTGVISKIYLVDGGIQLIFLLLWGYLLVDHFSKN
jgi:hypothetical protein